MCFVPFVFNVHVSGAIKIVQTELCACVYVTIAILQADCLSIGSNHELLKTFIPPYQ